MPRRTATPATPAPSAPLPPPPRDLTALAHSDPEWAANLHILRRHWKWANFSQFFYTFAPVFAMPDVFLSDVEDDLARGTNIYLPRIMHRLLYTLSQDRKLTIDNWQSALRRQYFRRDPAANPIGPEPKVPSRESSVALSEQEEEETKGVIPDVQPQPMEDIEDTEGEQRPEIKAAIEPVPGSSSSGIKNEPGEDAKIPKTESDEQPYNIAEVEGSKDWLELPMLEKLDSLHLVTEWHFQNPGRIRQLMKDDDDNANWRIEPVGYDAKTNAYWLIGPDRLWIQRVPPRPPRNRNLKRKRPAPTSKKPARPKAAVTSSDNEDEESVTRSKRTRTQVQSQSRAGLQTNGRATRSSHRSAKSSDASPASTSPEKSTRAAKVQANKKLDIQAKELAEYQRQTAALARASPRKSQRASASPAKRAIGTRVSARLRNAIRSAEDDDYGDDEWQQVPDEWLQEPATASRRTRARTRSKGKAKADLSEDQEEDSGTEDVEAQASTKRQTEEEELKDDEGGAEEGNDAEGTGGENDLLQKAGLEGGDVSDLTALSDQEDSEAVEEDEPPATRRRSVRKNAGMKQGGMDKEVNARSKSQLLAKEGTASKEDEDQETEEPLPLPADFVEWEAIAITLTEWEHVADPFEKATHYREKALYKMLTQNIVPIVTADLREAEKRRRMEEAIVHRKRSSRIAIKESEKEEARLAAKKKAEEEERLARSRRQEVRRKKEEVERAKRERARDQRAKEREEREARARAKAERAEREETAAKRSTTTPSVNGTQLSTSLQPSRVVTPNGVRTPDWVLDCEICRKQGVNVDDGMAMVSCNSCNRWQHIACHDLSDQRVGRPTRDWEKQQFYCMRCRQRAANGSAYTGQIHQGYTQQQYNWSQSSRPVHLQRPGGLDPFAHTSDVRYSHRSPIENGTGYPQQQYMSSSVGSGSYAQRSSYPNANAGLSFNHYQPDQRGLPSQGSWSGSNGYVGGSEQRMQSTHSTPQYAHNGSVYASSRTPSTYQNQSRTASIPQYTAPHDPSTAVSGSRWSSSTSNGYHTSSSAVQEAAQSLAFMHDGSSRYASSSGWPARSYGSNTPGSSQSHHSPYPQSRSPTNIDPLTGRSFSAAHVDQHLGHSLSPVNSTTSFNFPT